MSSKIEKLTYKSYIKIKKDLKKLIIETVEHNIKDTILELNSKISINITKYIDILEIWNTHIDKLTNITDISIIKKYLINNYSELEIIKNKIIVLQNENLKYDSKIKKIKEKISQLLIDEKCNNDWTIDILKIESEIKLILYEQTYITNNFEIEVHNNIYIINNIYYELYTKIENNTIIIKEIQDIVNKFSLYLKIINDMYDTYIINKGIEIIICKNISCLKIIINKFKYFTSKEFQWTETWNKTIQKYAILYDIKSIISTSVLKTIKKNIYLTTCSNIEYLMWKEIINESKNYIKKINYITQEKKREAQEDFLAVIIQLKKTDFELEKKIEKDKAEKDKAEKDKAEKDKAEAIKKAIEDEENIKKEKLVKKALLQASLEEAKEKARIKALEDEEIKKIKIIEKEIKLKEIEKIKKEEEKKEKERKRIEAEKKAAEKAAEKLLNQQKFFNKKK
jgi:hypothetical protein